MKIAVFGASGYIGTNLVKALAECGHTVFAGSRNGQIAGPLAQNYPWVVPFQYKPDDPSSYRTRISESDDIIYLSGPSIANKSVDASEQIGEFLIPFARMLEENARLANSRVLFASSGGSVYGEANVRLISEDHPTRPISPYGLLKLASEKYLSYFHERFDTCTLCLRISNPYGGCVKLKEGQGLLNHLVAASLEDRDITIWGDGSVVRDYLHMTDLVGAFLAAINGSWRHEIVNIGSGVGTSVRDAIEIVLGLPGSKMRVKYSSPKSLDLSSNILDIDRAGELLSWRPKIALSDGIGLAFRERRNAIKING